MSYKKIKMKSFFKEYGFAILTSVVVVALVAVCMVLKEPIQARLGEITNTWGNNVVNSLKFTNSAELGESVSTPTHENRDGLHYHGDTLYTGECEDYTYEEGKIVSVLILDFNGGKGEYNSTSQTITSKDFTTAAAIAKAYTNYEPTREGYTLLGWSLSSTATEATYTDAEDIPRTLGDNLLYYAVWKQNVSYAVQITMEVDEYPDNYVAVYDSDTGDELGKIYDGQTINVTSTTGKIYLVGEGSAPCPGMYIYTATNLEKIYSYYGYGLLSDAELKEMPYYTVPNIEGYYGVQLVLILNGNSTITGEWKGDD